VLGNAGRSPAATVPAVVPSVRQIRGLRTGSFAWMKTTPRKFTIQPGDESPFGLRSASMRVPASVPSVTHGSKPAEPLPPK
jgi:hypothetical protein